MAKITKLELVYLERWGTFYKGRVTIEHEHSTNHTREAMESVISELLGEQVEVPHDYYYDYFDRLKARLADKGIELDHTDCMDVS